jgi:hypothetical protein
MNIKKIAILAIISLLAACVTIPPEASELSTELGKRISAIESSNITLLNRFFDQKRREVDKFIEDEWLPIFANEFFSNDIISEAWNRIVSENNKKQRLMFLVKTGPKLQTKINEKRLELVQPLDALERRIEKGIREEYSQVKAMNNSITSFLLSAAKVVENRNRYLEMGGVTDKRIGQLIDQTDDAVSNLLGKGQDTKSKVDRSNDFIEKLRSIRDSI